MFIRKAFLAWISVSKRAAHSAVDYFLRPQVPDTRPRDVAEGELYWLGLALDVLYFFMSRMPRMVAFTVWGCLALSIIFLALAPIVNLFYQLGWYQGLSRPRLVSSVCVVLLPCGLMFWGRFFELVRLRARKAIEFV